MREKGVDELFAAAKRMKQEYGDGVEFPIVGSFEEEYKPLLDKLEQAGVVKYHGYQPDMKRFYAMASCVVLPSYHEGMSNVLLEGAATGRALITSDIPGCREAVEDGVVLPPDEFTPFLLYIAPDQIQITDDPLTTLSFEITVTTAPA